MTDAVLHQTPNGSRIEAMLYTIPPSPTTAQSQLATSCSSTAEGRPQLKKAEAAARGRIASRGIRRLRADFRRSREVNDALSAEPHWSISGRRRKVVFQAEDRQDQKRPRGLMDEPRTRRRRRVR